MAYDDGLVERVRAEVGMRDAEERTMFSSLAWFVGGNMAFAVRGDDLLVRVGPDWERALGEPHVEPFNPGEDGRKPMSNFVVVTAPGIASDEDLASWIEAGYGFAASLPAK